MENFFQGAGGGGLWNNPRRPRYSKEAEEMFKLRKEEAMLTNLQRKRDNRSTKFSETPITTRLCTFEKFSPNGGVVLTQTSDSEISSGSNPAQQCNPRKCQRRGAEACRAKNSYEREKFHPGPKRDLEEEKRRLQNIMATGRKKEPTAVLPGKKDECCEADESEETKRHQEVLNEIEERRQFLADMAALGQDRQYVNIINGEISQKLRELDALDQAGSSKRRGDN